ncbi:OmpH family outer membrane protein [Crocinitomix sp.]|nr:OmpH family outer membrane protein [Crocinitomix sp.]
MENNGSNLAKISLGISVVLLILVIVLFVKMPGGNDSTSTNSSDSTGINKANVPDDGILRICYFQADSLQNNLLLMKELEGLMADSQKKAEATMAEKERQLAEWEKKWATGGQLLPSEQQKYQIEAQQKQQEYMQTQQQVQATFAQEQEQYMFTLVTRITNAAKEYAKANDYDYVMSYQMGQNMMYYGAPHFDVTADLIRIMNDQYNERAIVNEEVQ